MHDEVSFPVLFRAITRPLCVPSVINTECGGSRLDDSRLENGISLTARGNDPDPDPGVELITNLFVRFEPCLPIHRAIANGNMDRLFFPGWMFGSVICSTTLNDLGSTHPLNFTPLPPPLLQLTPFSRHFPPPPSLPALSFRFSPQAYGNRGMLSPIQ